MVLAGPGNRSPERASIERPWTAVSELELPTEVDSNGPLCYNRRHSPPKDDRLPKICHTLQAMRERGATCS